MIPNVPRLKPKSDITILTIAFLYRVDNSKGYAFPPANLSCLSLILTKIDQTHLEFSLMHILTREY